MFDVSLVLVAVASWLVVAAVVGLFAWALARAAAWGDRDQLEQLVSAGALAKRSPRIGRPDREHRLGVQPTSSRGSRNPHASRRLRVMD